MSSTTQTFFVTGASGSQGGAVARQLLAAGHKVRALIRDPSKPSSQEIQKLGATIVQGDYDNIAALDEAAKGCSGVFLLSMPPTSQELQYAHNIIAASKAAGIKKIVNSTVTRAEEGDEFAKLVPGNPHFSAYWPVKKRVQAAVQNAGFESWTILQPHWMLTNFIAPASHFLFAELKTENTLVVALEKDTKVALTDPDDIGKFALKAFTEKGSGLENQIVGVVNEEMTIAECANVMSEVSGVKIGWRIMSDEEIEAVKNVSPLIGSQLWMGTDGAKVDLEKTKSFGVQLNSFKTFLENHKERLRAASEGQ